MLELRDLVMVLSPWVALTFLRIKIFMYDNFKIKKKIGKKDRLFKRS